MYGLLPLVHQRESPRAAPPYSGWDKSWDLRKTVGKFFGGGSMVVFNRIDIQSCIPAFATQ